MGSGSNLTGLNINAQNQRVPGLLKQADSLNDLNVDYRQSTNSKGDTMITFTKPKDNPANGESIIMQMNILNNGGTSYLYNYQEEDNNAGGTVRAYDYDGDGNIDRFIHVGKDADGKNIKENYLSRNDSGENDFQLAEEGQRKIKVWYDPRTWFFNEDKDFSLINEIRYKNAVRKSDNSD